MKKRTTKSKKEKLVVLEVDLPDDLCKKVQAEAKRQGISFDQLVNNAIHVFCEQRVNA